MAEKRCAVVTGGNKGIGFEICRQLADQGIMVVLIARDAKKGVELLRNSNILVRVQKILCSISLMLWTLQVLIPSPASSNPILGNLIFWLVNNAGISGLMFEEDNASILQNTIDRLVANVLQEHVDPETEKKGTESSKAEERIKIHESAEQCLQTNYYGAKRMTETFIPLLQLSPSPRIVNVSSSVGMIKFVYNDMARGVFSNVERLTEEKVDDVINEFLKDFKDDSLLAKNWPSKLAAYNVSKVSMNAYTRIIANKYPSFRVNCVCPGYARTDLNSNTGCITAAEAAESVVKLALLPDDGPSGMFFMRTEPTNF